MKKLSFALLLALGINVPSHAYRFLIPTGELAYCKTKDDWGKMQRAFYDCDVPVIKEMLSSDRCMYATKETQVFLPGSRLVMLPHPTRVTIKGQEWFVSEFEFSNTKATYVPRYCFYNSNVDLNQGETK